MTLLKVVQPGRERERLLALMAAIGLFLAVALVFVGLQFEKTTRLWALGLAAVCLVGFLVLVTCEISLFAGVD